MLKLLRRLSKSTVVAVNAIAVLCILLSYLSTMVSPLRTPYLAFFGISYGVILIVNLGFVVFWLLIKKRLALLSAIAILIGFSHLSAYFQLWPNSTAGSDGAKSIKVVSYNASLFGWYNWRTNKKDRDQILSTLAEVEADVICFQEYFHCTDPKVFEVNALVKKNLKMPYLYAEYGLTLHGNQNYGMAIASKYPIVGKGKIKFPNERGNGCIYADIIVENDTIRVYNAHVASIRFSESNYRFMADVQSNLSTENAQEGVNMVQRMSRAWQRRARHMNMIVEHIDSSPHPVIVGVDLNDTPVSHTYHQFSSRLNDAFRYGGWGIGNTYRGSFPSFRIDYIFADERFEMGNYRKLDETISDHHAVSCTVYLD